MSVRGLFREVVHSLGRRDNVFRIVRATSRGGFIAPFYHLVSNESPLHARNLLQYKNVRQFTDDLDFLLSEYTCVGLSEILRMAQSSGRLPTGSFFLSFDDGYREMADVVAPILLSKGIPATFFIMSDCIDNRQMCYLNKASLIEERLRGGVRASEAHEIQRILRGDSAGHRLSPGLPWVRHAERNQLDRVAEILGISFSEYLEEHSPYLSSSQIGALVRQGFSIGSHSIDHPRYSELSFDEQIRQTRVSVEHIVETYGLGYRAFSFPHSDQGVSSLFFERIAKERIVDIAFGTAGVQNHRFRGEVQRISMEKPIAPAQEILLVEYLKYLGRARTTSK